MAADDSLPAQDELEELEELLERGGYPPDTVENAVRSAALDRETYDDIRETAQRAAAQHWDRDTYYPYADYRGEFTLGGDPKGRPVGVTRRQLNEHMMVVGRSGAGKTTFFYNVMDSLNDRGIPFLAFDFKNDYRAVAADLDLAVVNWRDLKFNPLQPPPGVELGRWAEALAETWAHAMGVMLPSKGYFLTKLRQLYGLYEDEVTDGVYPTLFELRDLARADEIPYASPRYNYKERLVNRTTTLTGFSGSIFDCSTGYPVEELLERNVVLELQEPVREVQQFVVETVLTWIFYYREAQGHHGDGLRHAVLFDEAKQVFDRQREQDTDIPHPPITSLMGRVRAFGEALLVADHEPSKLSDSLKANTNLKLWLSLGSGKDTGEMADTFGVEDGKVDFTRTLERGEAVLKSAEKDPVPVQLLPFTVDTPVSEEDARERTGRVLDELSYTERVRPDLFESVVYDVEEEETKGEEPEESAVGAVAEALLASVDEQPFLSLSERYDAIDVGAKKGNRAKQELVTLGLVREVEIDTKKPGRNPTLLELTGDGEEVLAERGYDVAETGRRSIVHRYWQRQVADHYAAEGYDVEQERAVEAGYIDLYAEQGNTAVAVEVALSPEHEVANVEKCLSAGVELVEVVTVDEAVQDRIRAQVREAFDGVPDRVAFVDAAEYAD
jgi:hypothetical protein